MWFVYLREGVQTREGIHLGSVIVLEASDKYTINTFLSYEMNSTINLVFCMNKVQFKILRIQIFFFF